ncbi:histidine ammonia-lyase [Risungbinella massiliensis]|uniref:histidine ammonia-lyase n=1 Tax=Risungbinella massiliensis TaxID=1329796 RepID=UPI0005CC6D27
MREIILDGQKLTFFDYEQIVNYRLPIRLAPEVYVRMNASRQYVEECLREGRVVYGITTGFGKFSDQVIPVEDASLLQANLLMSHACGVGEPIPIEIVRGMLLLRIQALIQGYSGVRPIVVERLVQFLNEGLYPVVPSQGSLGASGDLAPLSHMALPIIGLGEVHFNGKQIPTMEAYQQLGWEPLTLKAKEGLALINGTQFMGSYLTNVILEAHNLLLAADIIGALTMEALHGIPDAMDPLLHRVRGQNGQIQTAANLLRLLQNSREVSKAGELRVQDAYTLRCIPQVHGASKDAFHYVASIMERELNAVTDNPLIFPSEEKVLSGGNFHGQPLALAADFLSIAMAEIANISERRTERLVNPQLSGLPAFLTTKGGLHSGYMIYQYVAASLVSENKVLAHPSSVDSIPSSANQEDHVSMGAYGTKKCHQILQNVRKVLAIEYICAAQAIEFGSKRLGKGTQVAYDLLRAYIPELSGDRIGSEDIQKATEILASKKLVEKVGKEIEICL